tara:strand:- start:596 stop:1027 length:432 start_codon:yes stop_codon:yes gene_type:complete
MANNPMYGSNKYDSKPGWKVNPGAPSTGLDGAKTLTIEHMLSQVCVGDPGGAVAWTLDTPALCVAGVPGVEVGDCIDFYVVNNGTVDAAEKITVTMPSGGTAVGAMMVHNQIDAEENTSSGHFRLRFTNVTASSEAYTVYRLA